MTQLNTLEKLEHLNAEDREVIVEVANSRPAGIGSVSSEEYLLLLEYAAKTYPPDDEAELTGTLHYLEAAKEGNPYLLLRFIPQDRVPFGTYMVFTKLIKQAGLTFFEFRLGDETDPKAHHLYLLTFDKGDAVRHGMWTKTGQDGRMTMEPPLFAQLPRLEITTPSRLKSINLRRLLKRCGMI